MTLLPFKIDPKIKTQTSTIDDGFGHSLDIVKYGCLTVEEADILHFFTLETTREDKIAFGNYKIELVFRLLCSRFNLPPETRRDQIFVYPDGTPMGEPMIEALHDFFENERTRWGTLKPQPQGKPQTQIGELSTTN